MNATVEPINLVATVCRYLDDDDWNYQLSRDHSSILTGVHAHNARFSVLIRADEQHRFVSIHTYLDCVVPRNRRGAVTEFLTRATYGLKLGNFEMDMDDGEVRYKTSIDVEGGAFTEPMFRNLIGANISTADRYYCGLMRVIYGGAAPLEAVRETRTRQEAD